MRIAQIAPLAEAVPPKLYGGTERVVYHLTEALVRRGHDVTLFASGDSETSARLVACSPTGLRLDPAVRDWDAHTVGQLGRVGAAIRAGEFDVVHNHIDYFALPLLDAYAAVQPFVTTLHGRLDLPDLAAVYDVYPRTPVVSVSDAQRVFLPRLNWVGTVHHGVAVERFPFSPLPGDYLAFLGRISPEKRPDRAIEIARCVGLPLKIAAKVDDADRAYYEHAIKPMIDGSLIEFVGELSEADKGPFLAGAYAYLFPIDWPEPFGLTMIEAMATGTPVIAARRGSVPEVIADGVSGFICDTLTEMVAAVDRVRELDRSAVRAHVERRFSVERMGADYEALLARLVGDWEALAGRQPSVPRWREAGPLLARAAGGSAGEPNGGLTEPLQASRGCGRR